MTQAVYTESAAPCTNCAPAAATSVTDTYVPQQSSTPQSTTPQPTIAPSESVPTERTYQETQRPTLETTPIEPEPASDASEESAKFEAPQLLNPNDRTAELHKAPVWTAVYHKPVETTTSPVQTVSYQQAVADADGWVSASE